MVKYLILASYSDDSVSGMLKHPADRATAVTKLCEAAGGRLESFHWMFGPFDAAVVVEMPDSRAMAAMALAVIGSHALKKFESYELIAHQDIAGIEEKARDVASSYVAPGREA
jgi:uncharacterized protein with GYD domain